MADRSAIEWTDASWNPIRARNKKTGKVGWHCEHATTGCVNCYSEGFNLRLGTGLPFKPGHRDDIELFLDNEMVLQPLRWKKPLKIFVCSMTDLFADFVPDVWIDTMFAVMALAPQHTFQVLTKRAKRMREYLTGTDAEGRTARQRIDSLVFDWRICGARPEIHGSARLDVVNDGYDACERWPLPNVWLGVSAERQPEADERIPELILTPAAVRFVSLEPLLAHVSLHALNLATPRPSNALRGIQCEPDDSPEGYRHEDTAKLDWVIVGGESGRDARPISPDWATSLRDHCTASGVAFFFKQWGEFRPCTAEEMNSACGAVLVGEREQCGIYCDESVGHVDHGGWYMRRVGKKFAGRLLDGIEHNEFPQVPV